MHRKFLFLALIVLGAGLNHFGQARDLSRAEYYAPLRADSQQRYKTSRREIMRLQIYDADGKLAGTEEEVTEYLLPDKKRTVTSEKRDGKTEKRETIEIGELVYERKNDGPWTKRAADDTGGGIFGHPVPFEERYTAEDAKLDGRSVKLYSKYVVFNDYEPKPAEEKQTFWRQSNWLDDAGRVIRSEITIGKPLSKRILSIRTHEYQYDLSGLKIEAPVK